MKHITNSPSVRAPGGSIPDRLAVDFVVFT